MAYEGELLRACDPRLFDFRQAHAVVVSGASWNPCGHALLNSSHGADGRDLEKSHTTSKAAMAESEPVEAVGCHAHAAASPL